MTRSQSGQIATQAQGNATTDQANAQSLYGTLMPSYTSQLANPGYTPAQQTAITGATLGGIGSAFGSSAEGAANRAARTNNSAGLTSSMDALARQRMVASGAAGAANQEQFANNAQQQTAQAQQGLQGLFGTSTGATTGNLGQANIGSANDQSFGDLFGSALAKSLGSISGSYSSPGGGFTGGAG